MDSPLPSTSAATIDAPLPATSNTRSAPRTLSSAAAHRKQQRKVDRLIQRQQQSAHTIIPYTSFNRLVHELVAETGEYCVRGDAVRALQEAAEDRVTDMFFDANKLAQYNGRDTVTSADLQFVMPADEWAASHPEPSTSESFVLPLPEPAQ